MKKITLLLTAAVVLLSAEHVLAQYNFDPFDDKALFVGYRVSTHTLNNPYVTVLGPDAGNDVKVTVPSYYMPFGQVTFGYNLYSEVSTYALDALYQIILLGSDINLSAPYIDDEETMSYAELDFLRYVFSSDWGSLPVSVGFQTGILNYGTYGPDVPDKQGDVRFDRPNLRFDNLASIYYGLNVGRSFDVLDGRHLYANIQYDWHLLYKESGSGSGNRISAFVHLLPIWDNLRATLYYRRNSTPYLEFQGVDKDYTNSSLGVEITYHIRRW